MSAASLVLLAVAPRNAPSDICRGLHSSSADLAHCLPGLHSVGGKRAGAAHREGARATRCTLLLERLERRSGAGIHDFRLHSGPK